MRKQEIIINILLIVFSMGMIFSIIPEWTAPPSEYGLAGSTLPTLCCAAIAVLAAFQLVSGILKGILPDGDRGLSAEVVLHVLKWFIPMFCIIPLWYYAGFLAGSIPVLLILLLMAGRRDFKVIIPLAALLPACVMLLLLYGLQVPTP